MKPLASPPERTYFAFAHEEWWLQEFGFAADELFRRGHVLGTTRPHCDLRSLRRAFNDLAHASRKDLAIFKIVEEFGLSSLRLTVEEQFARLSVGPSWSDRYPDEARYLRELRKAIWREVDRWYDAARTASSPTARSRARKTLLRLGQTLGGDLRGKRGQAVSPDSVRRLYCRFLFRLRRACDLFDAWPWKSQRGLKIKHVAEACGLEAADLRNFLGYSRRKPLRKGGTTIEYQARVLTGRSCGISASRVANLLVAPGGRTASRKSRGFR